MNYPQTKNSLGRVTFDLIDGHTAVSPGGAGAVARQSHRDRAADRTVLNAVLPGVVLNQALCLTTKRHLDFRVFSSSVAGAIESLSGAAAGRSKGAGREGFRSLVLREHRGDTLAAGRTS